MDTRDGRTAVGQALAMTFGLGRPAGYRPPPVPGSFIRVGRNARCPCGSGLKFKNCHLLMARRSTPF